MHRNHSVAALTVVLCACAGEPVGEPTAAPDQPGVEQLLGGALLPGHDEERLLREHALAGELARTIERLGGVEEARVHLALVDRSLLAREQRATSSAAIVVRPAAEAEAPTDAQLRELSAAAIPGLAPEAVTVFRTRAAPACPPLVAVGPLAVVADSAGRARAVLGGLLGACLLLACGLIYAGVRLRRQRRGSSGGGAG